MAAASRAFTTCAIIEELKDNFNDLQVLAKNIYKEAKVATEKYVSEYKVADYVRIQSPIAEQIAWNIAYNKNSQAVSNRKIWDELLTDIEFFRRACETFDEIIDNCPAPIKHKEVFSNFCDVLTEHTLNNLIEEAVNKTAFSPEIKSELLRLAHEERTKNFEKKVILKNETLTPEEINAAATLARQMKEESIKALSSELDLYYKTEFVLSIITTSSIIINEHVKNSYQSQYANAIAEQAFHEFETQWDEATVEEHRKACSFKTYAHLISYLKQLKDYLVQLNPVDSSIDSGLVGYICFLDTILDHYEKNYGAIQFFYVTPPQFLTVESNGKVKLNLMAACELTLLRTDPVGKITLNSPTAIAEIAHQRAQAEFEDSESGEYYSRAIFRR